MRQKAWFSQIKMPNLLLPLYHFALYYANLVNYLRFSQSNLVISKHTYRKVLLFRKSSLWGCYKPRHVTKRDMFLFINSKILHHTLTDNLIEQPYWTTLLDNLIGQPYCTALLYSLIVQPYCTTLLYSLIGQP